MGIQWWFSIRCFKTFQVHLSAFLLILSIILPFQVELLCSNFRMRLLTSNRCSGWALWVSYSVNAFCARLDVRQRGTRKSGSTVNHQSPYSIWIGMWLGMLQLMVYKRLRLMSLLPSCSCLIWCGLIWYFFAWCGCLCSHLDHLEWSLFWNSPWDAPLLIS